MKRPGKRATMFTMGGQLFFTNKTGTLLTMVEEYDFQEDNWCGRLNIRPLFTIDLQSMLLPNANYYQDGREIKRCLKEPIGK